MATGVRGCRAVKRGGRVTVSERVWEWMVVVGHDATGFGEEEAPPENSAKVAEGVSFTSAGEVSKAWATKGTHNSKHGQKPDWIGLNMFSPERAERPR